MAKMLRNLLGSVTQSRFTLVEPRDEPIVCHSPANLEGVEIKKVPLERFACKFPSPAYLPQQTCPDKCHCYFVPETQMTTIICSDQVTKRNKIKITVVVALAVMRSVKSVLFLLS